MPQGTIISFVQGAPKAKRLAGRTSVLNDEGMAVCGYKKVLGSLSEASRDSIKPTKIIFGKTVKKIYSSIVIGGDLQIMNLNEIEHSKR